MWSTSGRLYIFKLNTLQTTTVYFNVIIISFVFYSDVLIFEVFGRKSFDISKSGLNHFTISITEIILCT